MHINNIVSSHNNITIVNNNNKTKHTINGLVNISEKSYQITFYLLDNNKYTPMFTIIDTLTDPNNLDTFKREYFEDNKLKLTNLYVSSILKYSSKPLNT